LGLSADDDLINDIQVHGDHPDEASQAFAEHFEMERLANPPDADREECRKVLGIPELEARAKIKYTDILQEKDMTPSQRKG
jgi:hypothetical protein